VLCQGGTLGAVHATALPGHHGYSWLTLSPARAHGEGPHGGLIGGAEPPLSSAVWGHRQHEPPDVLQEPGLVVNPLPGCRGKIMPAAEMRSIGARAGGGVIDPRDSRSTPPRRLRRPGNAEQGSSDDIPAGARGREESAQRDSDNLRPSDHSMDGGGRRRRATTYDYSKFDDILVPADQPPSPPAATHGWDAVQVFTNRGELDERLNRMNLSRTELPELEEAMQLHLQFWRMRNLVLLKTATQIVRMLREAERYYREGHDENQGDTPWQFVFDENGVNTVDPVFGWNIGMHAAALGRAESFRAMVDLGFAKDDDKEEEFNVEDDDTRAREDKGKSRWQPPFMLDVGHKSFRRFSVQELYKPHLESARRQGVSEEELRAVFQGDGQGTAEFSGYMAHALSAEKTKQVVKVVWHDVVFPRGATALYIAKLFANAPSASAKHDMTRFRSLTQVVATVSAHAKNKRDQIQQDIEEKMIQAIEARRRADELMSLGYVDEAATTYSACMQQHNLFADAASSLMLLHLNQREQMWNKQQEGIKLSEEEREADEQKLQAHYSEALAAFYAWRNMDSDLFSLGVEKSSLLFRAAVSHVTGTGQLNKRAESGMEKSGMTTREFEEAQEAELGGTQIHVRGVGVDRWDGTPEGKGAYESKAALTEIFKQFGNCLQATIRHRIEGPSGKWDPEETLAADWPSEGSKNTSWALVTMETATAVNIAIKASETEGVYAGSQRLTLTRFDKEQTKGSTMAATIAQTASNIKEDRNMQGGQIRWKEMEIATELMIRLGPTVAEYPNAKDILDFTLQDSRGRTLKWLLRKVVESDEKTPFKNVPDGVSSSVPFFLQIVPDPVEALTYAIWPLFLVASCIGYYIDLALDVYVSLQYYEQGTKENTAEPEKLAYFWVGCCFYANGVLITCLFDMITTFVSRSDWQSAARRCELAVKCLLNLLQIRMPYECYKAFRSMKKTQIQNGQMIDRTARMPPMTLDQTKCAEGVFEALPQSMLQAFVVINDMMQGREVTAVQAASLLTSYGNCAVVLGLMGPPDITMSWRVIFMTFVVVNVILRSISFSFLAIMLERSTFGQELGPWATVLCLVVSYLVTLLFVFGLQRKKIGIPSFILSIIAFLCAVDISQFTVLKTAQPMTAQLPFAIVRYLEICIICYWFAGYQEYECLLRDGVEAIDILRSDGSRNVSVSSHERWQNVSTTANSSCLPHFAGSMFAATDRVSCHEMELDNKTVTGTNRWVFFENPAVYGRLSSEDVAASALYPFNMSAVLTALIMLNIVTYVLCNVIPYKTIDSTPKGLRRLWQGSEVKNLTKCCVSNTAFRKLHLVSTLATMRDVLIGPAKPRQSVNAYQKLQNRANELYATHRETEKKLRDANKLLKVMLERCNATQMNVESRKDKERLATFAHIHGLTMWWQDKVPEPEPEPAPAPADPDANHPEWVRRAQKALLYRASSKQRWERHEMAATSNFARRHGTPGRSSETAGPALAAATKRLRNAIGVTHERRATASVTSMDIERPLPRLRAASTTRTANPRAVTPRRHTEAPPLRGKNRSRVGAAAPVARSGVIDTARPMPRPGASELGTLQPPRLIASPSRVLTMLHGHASGNQQQQVPLPRGPSGNQQQQVPLPREFSASVRI
jgi:hypothetical protein